MSGTVQTRSAALWSRGMVAVLAAQFLSAMGDNALLFCTLALLKAEFYPEWTQPLLQEFFVGAYIVLAPFAGPLADALPKGRVMLLSNGLKLAGALGICVGLNPFLAYGLVGVGAASYSPAKYGILSELTTADKLVKANGLMESSTIAAILIGAIAGGTLADWNVRGALAIVAAVLGLSIVQGLIGIKIVLHFDPYPYEMAGEIQKYCSPTDKLLIEGGGWGGNELMLSDRKGMSIWNTKLLDQPENLKRLKELGYDKLVMISDSPLLVAVQQVNPGESKFHRQSYREFMTPLVNDWPTLRQTEDILIKEIP